MHQLENGYTKIANTLLEYFSKVPISGAGFRMVFWVLRNSYGYHRKNTKSISIRQLAREINMDGIGAVHLAVRVLIENGILIKNGNNEYSLNKAKLDLSVPKTEHLKAFPKLNTGVPKTEQSVPKTEHLLINKKDNSKETKERKVFTPPNLDEVSKFCLERNNHVNPNKWFSFYEANGWMVGRNKMKDWKASIRYWENNNYDRGNGTQVQPSKYEGFGRKL